MAMWGPRSHARDGEGSGSGCAGTLPRGRACGWTARPALGGVHCGGQYHTTMEFRPGSVGVARGVSAAPVGEPQRLGQERD